MAKPVPGCTLKDYDRAPGPPRWNSSRRLELFPYLTRHRRSTNNTRTMGGTDAPMTAASPPWESGWWTPLERRGMRDNNVPTTVALIMSAGEGTRQRKIRQQPPLSGRSRRRPLRPGEPVKEGITVGTAWFSARR